MKILKVSIITFSLSFLFLVGRAQTIQTVENLATKQQTCLDSGVDMLGCSKRFYFQMDSMLNVVYNKLKSTLDPNDKKALKSQQLAWLNKKDIYFKKQDKIFDAKYKKGEWGTDMEMISYDDKADFIKARVIVLIKRLKG